ncbi:MAG: UDP-glucose 4-epimerase GalE [Solirubrobacterales bacterium]
MRVLVTGGAGYIGSVTVEQLVERGDDVTVLDDLSSGHAEAVIEGGELVRGDLVDPEAVSAALGAGFDAVVHFAAKALVGESVREPELYRRVNVDGSRNLLAAMRDAGVGRIVASSTAAVYGEPERVPIDEDAPTEPLNPYGATKLAVDEMLAAEAEEGGLATASLRYFNVAGASARFGEDHDPETHLVPLILAAAAGARPQLEIYGTDYPTEDGTAVRDYVHVSDLARAHLLALDALDEGGHRVFNLGSGSGYSVREVVGAAERELGVEIEKAERERRPGDPAVLVASADRIERELGWRPERELEEMIASAWAFMQAHPGGY